MMQAIAVKGNSPRIRRQKAVQRTSVILSGVEAKSKDPVEATSYL